MPKDKKRTRRKTVLYRGYILPRTNLTCAFGLVRNPFDEVIEIIVKTGRK